MVGFLLQTTTTTTYADGPYDNWSNLTQKKRLNVIIGEIVPTDKPRYTGIRLAEVFNGPNKLWPQFGPQFGVLRLTWRHGRMLTSIALMLPFHSPIQLLSNTQGLSWVHHSVIIHNAPDRAIGIGPQAADPSSTSTFPAGCFGDGENQIKTHPPTWLKQIVFFSVLLSETRMSFRLMLSSLCAAASVVTNFFNVSEINKASYFKI